MPKQGKVDGEPQSPKRVSVPRMSITIDAKLRKKIRIAAARMDMEPNEWCKLVLQTAAKQFVERVYGKKEAE